MHHRNEPSGTRGRLRTAALLPAVVVAWMTLGPGAAMAAPGGHAAVTAAATAMPTDAGQANGKANGQTNGKANGQDNGKANRKADATTSSGTASGGSSDHSSGNAGTSGDPSQPQPVSNADQNSGGANGKCPGGPYCSTRDGSPSGNGNGGGKATGKPCAGCVGKADNKNPKGQMPNGTDHNAGYECDRNHGVGRSNPAHTGCTSTTPPPPCEETDTCPPPPCEETNTCPPPPCDEATEDCNNPPPCDEATEDCSNPPPSGCVPAAANNFCTSVLGEKVVRTTTGAVAGESTAAAEAPAALPFTGASIAALVAAATLALIAGGALLLAVRRRRT